MDIVIVSVSNALILTVILYGPENVNIDTGQSLMISYRLYYPRGMSPSDRKLVILMSFLHVVAKEKSYIAANFLSHHL
jgi:hypothetical protein